MTKNAGRSEMKLAIEESVLRQNVSTATATWDGAHHESIVTRTGPTALIAAMRCYVTAKLGDEIEIPEELR